MPVSLILTHRETSFDSWRAVMATNLDGVFLCSQADTSPKKSSGAIINIASISGLGLNTANSLWNFSCRYSPDKQQQLGEYNIR